MNRIYRKNGITLMEILVSLLIISFLTACSLPVLHRARKKALITKTKTIINTIEVAISLYETDFGDYPPGEGGGSEVIVYLLQGPVKNEKWNGPYIRFKKEEIDEKGNVIDAWKNPIIYKYPQSEFKNIPFLLISAGPDGKYGTNDDIGNW